MNVRCGRHGCEGVNGFVGNGIQSDKELPEVVVTGKKNKVNFTPSFIGPGMLATGVVGAIPIPKSILPKLPNFLVGEYGRNFIKGSPLTSVASLTSRRLGLGGEFGRAFPKRANLLGLAWSGVEIHTRITTDTEFMDYYDKLQQNNSANGFAIDGLNLIRIDYQKIELQKKQYNENSKKNPYNGFVF